MTRPNTPHPFAQSTRKTLDRFPAVKLIIQSAVHRLGYEIRRLPPPEVKAVHSYDSWPIDRVRFVIIGTTSACNASCVHCPTNKRMTKHLPKGVMPWDIFEKVIRGVRDTAMPIDGWICFGLFAEPLLDPLVVRRAAFTKALLPGAGLNLNTNGGPLTPELARSLGKYVDLFSVHIESVDPDVYHEMMYPLRAEDVFPKVEMLIRESGRPVNIVYPVHKKNLREAERLKDYWLSRGASEIKTQHLHNRCTDSLRFRELAVGSPVPTNCSQSIMYDLLVDWDGAVLSCCQDFLKRKVIGDMKVESVWETLASPARKEFFGQMRDGLWQEIVSCKDCFHDTTPAPVQISPRGRYGVEPQDAG